MTKHRRCFRLTRHRLLRIKQYTVIALISALSVCGFLALMDHMLFRGSRVSQHSFKASMITSDLRNLKSGTLSWHKDNRDRITLSGDNSLENLIASDDFMLDIESYVYREFSPERLPRRYNLLTGKYVFAVMNNCLYSGYIFGRDEDNVRAKLAGRAASIGLVKADGKTRYDKDDEVYLLVVNLSDQGGEK